MKSFQKGDADNNQAARSISLPVDQLSDEVLISAITRGAVWAMELLYERYSRILYSLAYRMVADHQVAEDLLRMDTLRNCRGMPDSPRHRESPHAPGPDTSESRAGRDGITGILRPHGSGAISPCRMAKRTSCVISRRPSFSITFARCACTVLILSIK
jgi:hypothetical protein